MTNETKPRGMNYLTVAERVAVIQEYDSVPNIPLLAKKYNCGRRQIRNILRRREEYLEEWRHNPNPQCLPRRQPSRIKAVNTLLYAWCQRAVAYGYEVTDEIIKEVGKKIADTIRIVEFSPEKRWLLRFKNKYNIDQMVVEEDSPVMNHKPSLEIDDLVRDLQPELDKLLSRKGSKPQSCKDYEYDPMDHFKSFQGETSSEPIECIDILSDSESEGSNENLRVPTGRTDNLPDPCMQQLYPSVEMTEMEPVKPLSSYREALNHLGPLEQFALLKDNIRVIGLINQIENILRDEMDKEN